MRAPLARIADTSAWTLAALVDLVLPLACGGCDTPGRGLCSGCAAGLRGPASPARPSPTPPGLPPCLAVGEYAEPLRGLILAYKERGRRGLAGPLGDALAGAIALGWPARAGPLALVPVPSTAAAARARHGDHMLRLARRVQRRLRADGVPATLARPLRALARPDSAHLGREARAEAAQGAFAPRRDEPGWRRLRAVADAGAVVLLDDVLTTGATLAAVASGLAARGVPVAFGVTLAATRLRG